MSPAVSPEIRAMYTEFIGFILFRYKLAKLGTGGGILTPKFPFGGEQFDVELTPAYYPIRFSKIIKNPGLSRGLFVPNPTQTPKTRLPTPSA